MRWYTLLLTAAAIGVALMLFGPDLPVIGELFAVPTGNSRSASIAPEEESRRIFASGVVEGKRRDVSLRFEVTGRVSRIHVCEGDVVAAGDVLAELDAEAWERRVAEAEARLDVARAERQRLFNGARPEARAVQRADLHAFEVLVRESEILYSRARKLANRNAASAQELDDQKFKYERAQAQLAAARARLSEIEAPTAEDELAVADARIALAAATLNHERSLLKKARLFAPSSGVVLHILVEPGELVGPLDERSLITMADRDRIQVRSYIEALDAMNVSEGQAAEIRVDGRPGGTYRGTVRSCSPFMREKSQRRHKPGELVDVKVREAVIELRDADDLVIGLPVDVFIDLAPAALSDAGSEEPMETEPQLSATSPSDREAP